MMNLAEAFKRAQKPYRNWYLNVFANDPSFTMDPNIPIEQTISIENKQFIRPPSATKDTIWTAVATQPIGAPDLIGIGSEGNQKYRQNAILSIILAVPLGTKTNKLLRVCEKIRLLYHGRRVEGLIFDTVQTFVDGRNIIEEKKTPMWFYGRIQAGFSYTYRNNPTN